MAKPPNVNPGDVIASAHINTVKETVFTWPENVNANNKSISNLDLINGKAASDLLVASDLNTLDGRVDSLETDLATAQGDITAAEAAIAAVEGDIVTLTASVGGVQSNVTALDGRLDTAEGDIAALESADAAQDLLINGIEADILSLQSDTAGALSRIGTAEGKITTAESDIDTLQSAMVTAQGDIVDLETVVNAATSDSTANTLAKRDVNGDLAVGGLGITGVLWDDVTVSVNLLAPGQTPADSIIFGLSGQARILGFDGVNTQESVEGTLQLPHKYKEGSNIRPHIHWTPTTAGTGNVKWFFEYYWINPNDTADNVPTTITAVASCSNEQWKHKLISFPEIVGTNKRVSSILIFRIYRNPADAADTYTADAGLISFDIHYQMDALGSKNELTKP